MVLAEWRLLTNVDAEEERSPQALESCQGRRMEDGRVNSGIEKIPASQRTAVLTESGIFSLPLRPLRGRMWPEAG
jgi:hypothetical protein